MKHITMMVIGFLLLGSPSSAVASRINPREDILEASTALRSVQDRQVYAEVNLLIDQAEESLKDKNKYHAYLFAQKALSLLHKSQISGQSR